MEPEQKNDFALTVTAMFRTFGIEATTPMIHGYWLGLCDMDLQELQVTIARAIREMDRPARPAELRRMTGRLVASEDRAIAAWGDVLKAIPLGAYKHVDFQDKLVNATIRNLGGWPTFLSRFTDAESEKWVRIEFCKAYASFANSGVNGDAIAPLQGLSEVSSTGGGLVAPIVRQIECDATRAEKPKLLSGQSIVQRLGIECMAYGGSQ